MVFWEERRCDCRFCGFYLFLSEVTEVNCTPSRERVERDKDIVVPAEDPSSGRPTHKDDAAFPIQSVKTWRSLLSSQQLQLRLPLSSHRPASSTWPFSTLFFWIPPTLRRSDGRRSRQSTRTPRGRFRRVQEVVGAVREEEGPTSFVAILMTCTF